MPNRTFGAALPVLKVLDLTARSTERQWNETAVWTENDVPIAVGWTASGWYRMELRGLAAFEWDRGASVVVAFPAAGRSPDEVREAYERSVLPFTLQTVGVQAMHASAVKLGASVAVFCARSGTGKSTLAYALAQQHNASLWADDVVSFDVRTPQVMTCPLPFSVRLRPASAMHFGQAPPVISGPTHPEALPISAVFVLQKAYEGTPGADASTVSRLDGVHAFIRVLEHAYCFGFDRALMRSTTSAYLELVSSVPIYSVTLARQLASLSSTTAAIVRCL